MICLWLLEVHVCCFFNSIHRFFNLCSLTSVKLLIRFEDVVQSLLNMCSYGGPGGALYCQVEHHV